MVKLLPKLSTALTCGFTSKLSGSDNLAVGLFKIRFFDYLCVQILLHLVIAMFPDLNNVIITKQLKKPEL